MRGRWAYWLVALSIGIAMGSLRADERGSGIVGGEEVRPQDPIAGVTVALMWEDLLLCTGTVLDYDMILTAAHCVGLPQEVVFSRDSDDPNAPRRKVIGELVHPDWDVEKYDKDPLPPNLNDVAVLRFEGGLPLGYRPVELVADDFQVEAGFQILIAGYGVNKGSDESGAGPLRKASVPVLDPNYGSSEFKIDASQGAGDCSGDSGGPAFVIDGEKWLQAGIDNWGKGLCDEYGVYAKTSVHGAWIEQAIRTLRSQQPESTRARIVERLAAR